jgi:hypothetical protein
MGNNNSTIDDKLYASTGIYDILNINEVEIISNKNKFKLQFSQEITVGKYDVLSDGFDNHDIEDIQNSISSDDNNIETIFITGCKNNNVDIDVDEDEDKDKDVDGDVNGDVDGDGDGDEDNFQKIKNYLPYVGGGSIVLLLIFIYLKKK